MTRRPGPVLLAALLLAGASGSGAQAVYRCGPDRNLYSQQPCADGAAIDPRDGRTAGQRADAEAAARREQAQADRMERERLAQERSTRGGTAIPLTRVTAVARAASAPKAPAAKRKSSKKKPEDEVRVFVPAPAKPKKASPAASAP